MNRAKWRKGVGEIARKGRGRLLLLAVAMMYGLELGAAPDFRGVEDAEVVMESGMPILKTNGDATPPLVFFFNTETGHGQEHLAPQVEMAANAGVQMYSMPFDGWAWSHGDTVPGPEGFAAMDAVLDRFLAVNPQALFIPRIRSTPPHSWPGWDELPDSERIQYLDGESPGYTTAASDLLWEAFTENVVRFITHYENSPYGKHFLGYHIGGQNTNEWFQWDYRVKGPDYSEANQQRFREWLRVAYGDDAALSAAWSKEMRLEDAAIPMAEAENLPMWALRGDGPLRAFYDLPEEQAWVDYSRYYSDLIAERITEAAALIKEATGGRKLSVFFYGYVLELSGSYGGHHAMEQVLNDPNVDVLVAPLTYSDRLRGGAEGPMTAVDSVAAHGKLWLNEDDMRTHLIERDELPSWLSFEAFGVPTADFFETQQLLLRNLGLARIHRHGTWWMDLISAGAFRDADLWDSVMAEVGHMTYSELYAEPEPYRSEVAMIIDERSQSRLYNSYDAWVHTLHHLRDNLLKSGASVGFYYLQDFLDGKVPEARVYLFANAFEMQPPEVHAVLQRLRAQSATAVWQYAPGYFTADGVEVSQMQRLTGFPLQRVDGPLGITGEGAFAGMNWGWARENHVEPRFVVEAGEAAWETLGSYQADDLIAAARRDHAGFTSIFSGDIALDTTVLRAIFRDAGVHLWVEDDSVVHCDGRLLVIHTADGGDKRITLPPDTTLHSLTGEPLSEPGAIQVTAPFQAGETRWFRLEVAK